MSEERTLGFRKTPILSPEECPAVQADKKLNVVFGYKNMAYSPHV